ncbi:phosphatidylinositol 3-kinase [Mycena floridula]|nr:phosphatidylinositol 3-kinase [Mycena floridula]
MSNSTLNEIFQGLKSKSHQVRLRHALQLRRYIATMVVELSSDAAEKLWDEDINHCLFELMHSAIKAEQFGGLMAIDNLLEVHAEETIESKRNLFRFYNYVKQLLPNSDLSLMLAASRTLGRIVRIGGQAFGEQFMDYEVSAAVELIRPDKRELPRYAGVLILNALAHNSPPIYFHNVHVELVLDNILVPLRDTRIIVREVAAELLAACLEMVVQRETQISSRYLSKILEDAAAGLELVQPETIYGSLLMYRELLLHAGPFMKQTFLDTGDKLLKFRHHRDGLVRRMVMTLIPTLAAYDVQIFSRHFLKISMSYLLSQLEKPAEYTYAFGAIGHTAMAIGSQISPFLESIMSRIKLGLRVQGNKKETMFRCLAMLAAAVGPRLTQLLHDQLDIMFACGLSDAFRQALVAITRHIPALLETIQGRLLNLLSMILIGQPYKSLDTPLQIEFKPQMVELSQLPELVTLALSTLGSFDFSDHILDEFLRIRVLPYLDDDDPEVRRAAASSFCRLFYNEPDPIRFQASPKSTDIVSQALDKLLSIGIADPDPMVRQTVLSSLHERFDKHLAQAENIRTIFKAMNDELFDNREVAVTLIGRLSMHNPAYVMPSLSKALLQLLTEFEYSTARSAREESIRLLTSLVGATRRLIKPYAPPMLKVLLQKPEDRNSTVAANVLLCIGELTAALGPDAMPNVPDIIQILIARLEDSSVKRNAALRALGQICSSTGYVVAPVIDYPELLPLLGKILRTATDKHVRREVVKVLGILGALDPNRLHKMKTGEDLANETAIFTVHQVALQPSSLSRSPLSVDDSQTVVLKALLDILNDRTLVNLHYSVIEAIMTMFKTQGLQCLPLLPQVMPAFFAVTRNSAARLQDFHLQQLGILISIIKDHVRNYVPDICRLILDLWDTINLQFWLISLIEAVGKALYPECKPFLQTIIPLMLTMFDGQLTEKRINTQMKIMDVFLTFGAAVEEYLHLVLPILAKSFGRPDATDDLRKQAIQTIIGLSKHVDLSDHASRIIHPLLRVLDDSINSLQVRAVVMDALCALIIQLETEFLVFVPIVSKCLVRNGVKHLTYEAMISKLLKGEGIQALSELSTNENANVPEISPVAEAAQLVVNQQHLKQSWDISRVTSREDWLEWMARLSVEFMKESPSYAFRACASLAKLHPPLAQELFNPAFLSCHSNQHLDDRYRVDLIVSIESAMMASTAPPELIHRLLNLADFMERREAPLTLDFHIFADCALRNLKYAQALHYKEIEFFDIEGSEDRKPRIMESIISINARLQQHDAAWGALIIANQQYDIAQQAEWFERLGRWQEALIVYDRSAQTDQRVQFSRMKCLHALGDWNQLASQVEEHWQKANLEYRQEIAPIATAAAWSLNNWDLMHTYITAMDPESPDKAFYKAILLVHQNQFSSAVIQIAKARDRLEPELASIDGEGYERVYSTMVRAQMLSELEEIITYKQLSDQPDRQRVIRDTWMTRLKGCQPDVDVWQRILQVRTLVLNPEDDPIVWTKFTNLCRKSDRMALAEKSINSLLSPRKFNILRVTTPPQVIYAQLKYMWMAGTKEETLQFLRGFSSELLAQKKGQDTLGASSKELSNLLARCFFKQGQWEAELLHDWGHERVPGILYCYLLATRYDDGWYKAWHTWASANLEVVSYMEAQQRNHSLEIPAQTLLSHVVQAIDGFFQTIVLRSSGTFQNTLRLLTLWFKFGAHDDVSRAMESGFSKVVVDTWLEVIPQLIARIQIPHANIQRTLNNLLDTVGKIHPQALIYIMTVAMKSSSSSRQSAARSIMSRMREHSQKIVDQTRLVSQELIRVAILWHELWHEALEEASRLYLVEGNITGMIALLEPLHDMLQRPTTTREITFVQLFGMHLRNAREACRRYLVNGDPREIDAAWDIYVQLFQRFTTLLTHGSELRLENVAPELLRLRDLDIAMPGTYQSGREVIKVTKFDPRLPVLHSKQKPRRLCLTGSDGRDYQYLLKGHDDLRQEERVMQLFSLVNTRLAVDTKSLMRRLHIQPYPVIPLAPNVGLIGWMQDTDTLQSFITNYRKSRKIRNDLEFKLMLEMAPDYSKLALLQKVEAFEYVLENTTGRDLSRSIWLESRNPEHWLERRTCYTRSLAVNSMVGHILGLGDRHPSNILLEKTTGKLVHIDFGDCFEVAMNRTQFAEKVPFRLTRMLVYAMEVSGIEGSFRNTCEITMEVLRDNKESLEAVLETFVYDPLINWRLMQVDGAAQVSQDSEANSSSDSRASESARAVAQASNRRPRADENMLFDDLVGEPAREMRDEKALAVYNRVQDKLRGKDFGPQTLEVKDQVEKLIAQATSIENLCQHFHGWAAFW